ncbi:hypothetical protein, variant [Capsaspora owczarzaki ATCC 30864]|uniref:HPt domain-containing protein n=1 Tax=Capsaspora owczarzaki (strain ATCC 30864) TaxID=595528 RepID=A0A0D2U743_CAPO3|nr:hypothetical protein, variant [Capsaspora owczarzaki ATCC 30864]
MMYLRQSLNLCFDNVSFEFNDCLGLQAQTTVATFTSMAQLDETTSPIIDYESFNAVKECDDDPSFLESIVNDYIEQLESKKVELFDLHQKGELQQFSQVAHFLKSSSATLGVARLRYLFGKLQIFAQEGAQKDPAKVNELVLKVDPLVDEAVAKLKSEVDEAIRAASS